MRSALLLADTGGLIDDAQATRLLFANVLLSEQNCVDCDILVRADFPIVHGYSETVVPLVCL